MVMALKNLVESVWPKLTLKSATNEGRVPSRPLWGSITGLGRQNLA
jgi:hypothetical protein